MSGTVKNILLRIGLLGLVACSEEPDKILYKGPDFVFFDSKPQITMYENQKTPLVIPLKVSLAQSTNTLVAFEVVGVNILPGADYNVQTSSPVEILRSKYESSISILPVDNNVIQTETRTLRVRILSVDNPNLSVQVVKEIFINLLDDDCAPTIPKVSLWIGDVNVQGGGSAIITGTGAGGNGGICGGTLVVTAKFFGAANPSSNMTIIMTQNPVTPTKGIASVIRFPLFEGSDVYQYEASGTYDETAKNITLNFSVYDTTDPAFSLTGTHVITPQ